MLDKSIDQLPYTVFRVFLLVANSAKIICLHRTFLQYKKKLWPNN